MSSVAALLERFLLAQGFERGPWLTIAFVAGIAAWFMLGNRWQWLALSALLAAVGVLAAAFMLAHGRYPHLRQALIAVSLMMLAGIAVIWVKSALVGEPPIERTMVGRFAGVVVDREDQPADARVRLMLETHDPGGRPIRVRLNLPLELDNPAIAEGSEVTLRARLVPPAPPLLPGAYDFARTAWFAQISATGTVLDPVTVTAPGKSDDWLREAQVGLSRHVRGALPGTAGTIASAYASGDQAAIPATDQQAMRDAGLTHLLSISGLHVSAVIGAAYALAMGLLALIPWLALRVRLPVVAAGFGALAAIGYTLLTGAQVPTIRSCIGALLVLAALVIGREPLSLRLLAVGAFVVLLFWPEALAGPSFQLSFAAVLAIVSVHGSAPMRRWLSPREEGMVARLLRATVSLLVTGAMVELALLPIGLFHFHRAGLYGVIANVVAIPLTTFVTMPLLGLALLLDLVGLGGPFWALTGLSIDAMLTMAHWFAAQPGAVTLLPAMGRGSFAVFCAGGLWLALWRGRARLWGLVPICAGCLALATLRPPDLLVSGDGRHVGIVGEGGRELLVLRENRTGFTTDTLSELAGMSGNLRLLSDWPGAQCNEDFCTAILHRGGRDWRLAISRGHNAVPERALVATCDRVDIVIADRWLPHSCKPAFLKADRTMLEQTGGLAIDLAGQRIATVADSEGEHGWWRPVTRPPRRYSAPRPLSSATTGANPAPQ